MKILNLSLDRNLARSDSPTLKRLVAYGELVEDYFVVAIGPKEEIIKPSPRTQIWLIKDCGKIRLWFKLKRTAKKIIEENQIDLITVQDTGFVAYLGFLLAKRFHLALEVQVHGFEKSSGFRKLLLRHVLPEASGVRVVSQRLMDYLINMIGVRPDKISVIPVHVADRPKLGNNSSGLVKRQDHTVFLTVGRLVEVKNIELQLQALAKVKNNFPKVELWIVGAGPLRQALEACVVKYNLVSEVTFYGERSDVDSFYAEADVFLLTSFSEGWPLVIVEAAKHGLPIVMTDVGSAGDLIINKESGLVVPINDVVALTTAMGRLIQDEELRLTLGRNAKLAAAALPSEAEILGRYRQAWVKAIEHKL